MSDGSVMGLYNHAIKKTHSDQLYRNVDCNSHATSSRFVVVADNIKSTKLGIYFVCYQRILVVCTNEHEQVILAAKVTSIKM